MEKYTLSSYNVVGENMIILWIFWCYVAGVVISLICDILFYTIYVDKPWGIAIEDAYSQSVEALKKLNLPSNSPVPPDFWETSNVIDKEFDKRAAVYKEAAQISECEMIKNILLPWLWPSLWIGSYYRRLIKS